MKPSRWWHLLSALLLPLCGIIIPVAIIIPVIGLFFLGEEFFTPGTHDIRLDETGSYTILNVNSEFRDGKQYNFPSSLPNGARLRIIEQSTGKEIPVVSVMNFTEESGNTKRTALCGFSISSPGVYSIIVDGTSEKRILMVRHSIIEKMIWRFVIASIFSLVGWLLPPIISAGIEIMRWRAGKATAEASNPAS